MELYDSIFWGESTPANLFLLVPSPFLQADLRVLPSSAESPDPWNSGLDTMNFDFLAQPPPGQPPQQQFYF